MPYSDRVPAAMQMAFDLHRSQVRKGSDVPYITHLMLVAGFVGDYGGSEDEVIAAFLHDAAEDQGGLATLKNIRVAFGDNVAKIVEECSDTFDDPKPAWQARKERFIESLSAISDSACLVVAADKLHNALAIVRDLRELGPGTWSKFKGGREGTLWNFDAMLAALRNRSAHPILDALEDAIEQLHETADLTEI